jgi:hypothetical protein
MADTMSPQAGQTRLPQRSLEPARLIGTGRRSPSGPAVTPPTASTGRTHDRKPKTSPTIQSLQFGSRPHMREFKRAIGSLVLP